MDSTCPTCVGTLRGCEAHKKSLSAKWYKYQTILLRRIDYLENNRPSTHKAKSWWAPEVHAMKKIEQMLDVLVEEVEEILAPESGKPYSLEEIHKSLELAILDALGPVSVPGSPSSRPSQMVSEFSDSEDL